MNDEKPGRTTKGSYLQFASATLFLLAFAFCGAGVAGLRRESAPPSEERSLLLDQAVKSFGDAPSKTRVAVTFALTNRSERPVSVIGATPFCGRHGCVEFDKLPLNIPPRSEGQLVVYVETGAPGQFNGEMTLFLRGAHEPETVLGVKGNVVDNDGEL